MPALRPSFQGCQLKTFLRRLWRVPAITGWILLGLLLAVLLLALPGQWRIAARQSITRWWMRLVLRLLPLRIQQHGRPTEQTAVWVGNHISWLDILLLGAQAKVCFIAKAEVRQWPVLGWLAHSAGTLFIQRGKASASNLNQRMTALLEQGQSLVVFAEGTTTAGDQVRTFHGRLLSCAVAHQLPVQPVALAYRSQGQLNKIAPFINDDEFSAHLWRLLGSATIDVELHFPATLHSAGMDRNQLARSTRRAVCNALQLTDEPVQPQHNTAPAYPVYQSAESLSAAT